MPTGDATHQHAAPTCLAIRIVTGVVLAATAGLLIAAVISPPLAPVAALLTGLVVYCYRTAPVAFQLDRRGLTVIERSGQRTFAQVVRCRLLERKPGVTLRVWGNGGLFAGTGFYWNRQWGLFRAYVTAGRYTEYVLVETRDTKVLISPENPAAFVEACKMDRPDPGLSGGRRAS